LIAFAGFNQKLIKGPYSEGEANLFIRLGPAGKIIYLVILLSSVLILLNFERTFRSAVGVMRWRIKYFILGAGLIFGAKLYISSQVLLYSGIHGILLEINSVVVLGAGLLMAYSLARTKLADSEIYPSHQVLQHSLTAVVAGIYLLCLGLLA